MGSREHSSREPARYDGVVGGYLQARRASSGKLKVSVTPSPSCPLVSAPQQVTVPSLPEAQLCAAPAVTAPLAPATSTGRARSVVVPSPSCPLSLAPQQSTRRSASSTQVCAPPAATSSAGDTFASSRGAAIFPPVAPIPSCPRSFAPQQKTSPAGSTAQVCCPPAESEAAATPPGSAIRVGSGWSVEASSPISPWSPRPQHQTCPATSTAQVWPPPAVTDEARIGVVPLPSVTTAGVGRDSVVPSPSWP